MINLVKAALKDAKDLYCLQVRAFIPLLHKYQDYETNPANEPIEKMCQRITDPTKEVFKIMKNDLLVGGVVVKFLESNKLFIGPIFVDPDFQKQKIAQKTIFQIENMFGSKSVFELITIKEEQRLLTFYQKLGYKENGKTKSLSEKMTLVHLEKKGLTANE